VAVRNEEGPRGTLWFRNPRALDVVLAETDHGLPGEAGGVQPTPRAAHIANHQYE
jgi:hypothetical protein